MTLLYLCTANCLFKQKTISASILKQSTVSGAKCGSVSHTSGANHFIEVLLFSGLQISQTGMLKTPKGF